MNNEKEKWVEDVFQSMKGSERAKPQPDLFEKIQSRIRVGDGKVLNLFHWKYASAAAVLILFMNITALVYFNQQNKLKNKGVQDRNIYNRAIINTYQIY